MMPNMKLETYDRVWRAIKEIGLRLNKRRIPEAEKGFKPRRILLGREEKNVSLTNLHPIFFK